MLLKISDGCFTIVALFVYKYYSDALKYVKVMYKILVFCGHHVVELVIFTAALSVLVGSSESSGAS